MPRVLIIDDDGEVRAVLRRLLGQAGYEPEEAADGEEGLEALRLRRPDVVLCDLYMPGRDGIEVIWEAQQEHPGLPVIAMSGGACNGRLDLLAVARDLGAAATLDKPFG